MDRAEFLNDHGRPIIENPGDRDPAGDTKPEIQVGEAVAAAYRQRIHDRPGHDAVILMRAGAGAQNDQIRNGARPIRPERWVDQNWAVIWSRLCLRRG